MSSSPLDILALAAHRDDVEQTCGGTLLKMGQLGHRTGILDLTQGEMGTRGTAEDRAQEAAEAARILRVFWREALDIPDGRVENTWENRLKVASESREFPVWLKGGIPITTLLPSWDMKRAFWRDWRSWIVPPPDRRGQNALRTAGKMLALGSLSHIVLSRLSMPLCITTCGQAS